MHGIPVLIHCWYKTVQKYENESDPSNIANLAAKFPDLKIIMAHITGCGFRGIQDIAPYPNVYVDTSGSQPEDGIMQYGLDLLGADRILFGSDFPGRDPATQLGRIYSLDMSEEDRNKILGGNSVRLFGGAF
jgi:predicted TIM-barrel fold metal-dependent hydrolase